jgi:hypothetical protein
VSANEVLIGLFVPKKEEAVRDWRRLLNMELCNLYASPDIVRVISSGRMRWAAHATRVGKVGNEQKLYLKT